MVFLFFFFFYPFLRLAQSNCPRANDTLALHYTCRGSIKTQADFTSNVKITSWKCVWPEIWPVFAYFWVQLQLSTVQLVPVFKYIFLYLSSIHPSSTTFTLKGSGGCSCLRGFLLSVGLTYRDKQPFQRQPEIGLSPKTMCLDCQLHPEKPGDLNPETSLLWGAVQQCLTESYRQQWRDHFSWLQNNSAPVGSEIGLCQSIINYIKGSVNVTP